MAARPNALRTLEYGNRLAENQITRLNDMIQMAENVLATNKTLTPADVAGYKECVRAAKKQLTSFKHIAEVKLPTIDLSTKRKRGRPSKDDLSTLAASRGEKTTARASGRVAAQAAPAAEAPKRRGRPPKAPVAVAAPAVEPKRRGRPPKIALTAPVPVAEPKRRGRPPKNPVVAVEAAPAKKPGRKPKAVAAAPAPAEAPKRRGRPPKAVAAPEVAAAAPAKKRGRKPAAEHVAAAPFAAKRVRKPKADAQPVAQAAAPVKRRGRPPKSATLQAVQTPDIHESTPPPEYNTATGEDGSTQVFTQGPVTTKRGPGRPKGSKNRPSEPVINGQNATVHAA